MKKPYHILRSLSHLLSIKLASKWCNLVGVVHMEYPLISMGFFLPIFHHPSSLSLSLSLSLYNDTIHVVHEREWERSEMWKFCVEVLAMLFHSFLELSSLFFLWSSCSQSFLWKSLLEIAKGKKPFGSSRKLWENMAFLGLLLVPPPLFGKVQFADKKVSPIPLLWWVEFRFWLPFCWIILSL